MILKGKNIVLGVTGGHRGVQSGGSLQQAGPGGRVEVIMTEAALAFDALTFRP